MRISLTSIAENERAEEIQKTIKGMFPECSVAVIPNKYATEKGRQEVRAYIKKYNEEHREEINRKRRERYKKQKENKRQNNTKEKKKDKVKSKEEKYIEKQTKDIERREKHIKMYEEEIANNDRNFCKKYCERYLDR